MNPPAVTPADRDQPPLRGVHVALWAGAAVCLTGAGLLLWAVQGQLVFTDVVSAALAWCF